MNDYLLLSAFITIILFASFFSEKISKKGFISKETARKLLHITACLTAAYSSILIQNSLLLLLTAIAASIITFIAVKKNLFSEIDNLGRQSWGIFFVAFSYLLLLLFFAENNSEVIFTTMLILAFSDSFAALAGNTFAKRFYSITSDRKSYLGSSVFFIITFTTVIVTVPSFFEFDFPKTYLWHGGLIIAILLTVFEAISSKGLDNFSIPLFGSFLIYLFFVQQETIYLNSLSIGIILAFAVAFISFKVKFLTIDGSAATFLLASFVFGFGGWKWTLPILTFFILSSILSKVRKNINGEVEHFFEKSSQRDYMQVIANGGIGGLLVMLNTIYPHDFLYVIYIASLSAVCADTWGTEIGTMTKTKTYNILNLKLIEQGMSGGISFIGTLGAAAGTIFIAMSGVFWIDGNSVNYLFVIIFAGLFGSMFDSVLGATLQARFLCPECGKLTEKLLHCGKQTTHSKGINWLNNDIVNLIAGLSGGLIVIFIL